MGVSSAYALQPPNVPGLLPTEIARPLLEQDPRVAAARAGLKTGDVILGIANAEVSDVKQFEAAVAKADKSKPVNVLFRRGEWTQYVLIRPIK